MENYEKIISQVLGFEIQKYDFKNQILFYRDEYDSLRWTELPIDELSEKCQKWANEKNLAIKTVFDDYMDIEDIINACELILNNINEQEVQAY